jgi:hypothetical protein
MTASSLASLAEVDQAALAAFVHVGVQAGYGRVAAGDGSRSPGAGGQDDQRIKDMLI